MKCTFVVVMTGFVFATRTQFRAPSRGTAISLATATKMNATMAARIAEKVRAGAAEASLDQRVFEQLKNKADCQSKAPSVRCKELCESSNGCEVVCDEVRAMICSSQGGPEVISMAGGQTASDAAASAAAAATSAVRNAIKDAVAEVAKSASEASAAAQQSVKAAVAQANGIAKQAAKDTAAAAAVAAARSASKEAAESAHAVASTAAAAAINAARSAVAPAKAPAGGAAAPAPGPGPAPAGF